MSLGLPQTDLPAESSSPEVCFRALGQAVSLSVPDEALVRQLAALLGLPTGPGRGDRSIECRIQDGRFIVQIGVATEVCESRDDLLVLLATMLPSLLLDRPGYHVVHAGAFAIGNDAHLFLGPSYIGKSTLALEAWLSGLEVLGDDYLFIEATSGVVEPVPKPVRIRLPELAIPERLRSVLPTGFYALGCVEGEPSLMFSRALPRMAPAGRRYRIGSMHVLRRTGGRETLKRSATKHEAMGAILEQTFVGSESSLGVLRCFAAAMRDRRAFILEVGENDSAGAVNALLS